MQKRLLELLHNPQKRINSTLRSAHHMVFWLNMTIDSTEKIKNCSVCQLNSKAEKGSPTKSCSTVGIDLFKFKDTHYMVIGDYTTDYMKFERLTNQLTQPVLSTLKKCFNRLGIPKMVMTDNGPQFPFYQFTTFSKD